MMKKKSSLCVLSITGLFALTIGLAACDEKKQESVKYTVSFNTNGGNSISPMTYTGEALKLPEPSKTVDGRPYLFEGWYLDESLTGEEVSSPYTPTGDVTLYASWTEGSKISVYYGGEGNYEDIIVEKDSQFSVDDLADYEDPITVRGVECPFVKWVFATLDQNGNLVLGEDFTETFTASEPVYYISAVYNEDNVPKEQNLEDNGDGTYRITGNVNWALYEGTITDARGVYEADISFAPGSNITGGAVGIAWRGTFNNADQSYEKNSDYMSVQLGLDKDTIQVASVTYEDGFGQIKGSKPTVLPESYTSKVAELKAGGEGSLHLTVVDNGDSFKAYVDDVLVYDYNYGNPAASSSPDAREYDASHFTGTGFGVRASKAASGSIIGNFKYTPMSKITLDGNGGTIDGNSTLVMDYLYGTLPEAKKDGAIFNGWFEDEECTVPFDSNSYVKGDMTLYAGWTTKVTLNFYTGNKDLTGVDVELAKSQEVDISTTRTIDLSTIPEPSPLEANGLSYPFDHWELDGEEVSGVINIDQKAVYDFYAVYDTTGQVVARFSSDGTVFDTVTISSDESKVINLDEIKPTAEVANGREFLHWTLNGDKVTGEFTLVEPITEFVAVYRQNFFLGALVNVDLGDLYPNEGRFGFDEQITDLIDGIPEAMTGDFSKIKIKAEPARINMLGNTAYPYIFKGYDDVTEVRGVYEADIIIDGKCSGAIGIAWRGTFAIDDPETASYEANCNYVSVQIGTSKGKLQVGQVKNGKFSELKGSKPADSTYPPIFNKQLTDYRNNGTAFTAHFKVIDFGDYFVLYVGDELVFESNNPDPTSTNTNEYVASDFKGTGFGWRNSNKQNCHMANFEYHTLAEAEELGLIPAQENK